MQHKQMSLGLLSVGAMALVLLGVGCADTNTPSPSASPQNDDNMMMEEGNESGDTMMKGDSMNEDPNMVGGDAMMEKDGDAMMEVEVNADAMMKQSSAGTFTEYTDGAIAVAGAESDTIVLAFFADWCSTCRAAKSDINAQLDEIPAGLTILDVNYDTATELRQKYGVTTQHTYVEVDAEGNMVRSWRGGNTLQSIVDQVS